MRGLPLLIVLFGPPPDGTAPQPAVQRNDARIEAVDLDPSPAAAQLQTDPQTDRVEPAVTESAQVPAQPDPPVAPGKPKVVPLPSRSVGIPAIGPVQPWLRLNVFSEYFRRNYDFIERNENFVSLVSRLNLGADISLPKGVRLLPAVRLDTQNLFFLGQHACDEDNDGGLSDMELRQCRFRNDIRLERARIGLESRYVDATVGDFQIQYGRGIPLSVRRIDQIGIDATIKGGRVDVDFGKKVPIDLSGFAGYANSQNSDFATRALVEDPGYPAECDVPDEPAIGNRFWTICSDLLAGGRADVRLPGKVDLGMHYVHVDFGQQIADGVNESIHLAGGDIGRKRIGKVWDIFAGGTALVRVRDAPELDVPTIEGVDYTGYSTFLGNSFVIKTTTIVVEAKANQDYLVAVQPTFLQYSEAPTLEREDQQVPGNFSSMGGRVRVDHTIPDLGLTLYVNGMSYSYAEAIEEDHLSRSQGISANHGYAGFIWRRKNLMVQASGGYRYEFHFGEPTGRFGVGGDADGERRFRRKFPHLEFYTTWAFARQPRLGLTHTLSARFEGRLEDKQVTGFDDERFTYGFGVLGYSLAPYFQLSFIQGFSTEFPAQPGLIDLTGEECGENALCKPHLWPGVEVRFNIIGNNFIRVFAGRQVGGRVCVNGSCRTVPDFEGVRGEVVLSF